MSEFLKPEDVAELPFSKNPYLKMLQAANRIGLMGVRIEDIERTFPLGATDVLIVAYELEVGGAEHSEPQTQIVTEQY